MTPAIIVLTPSALATARRVRGALAGAELHGLSSRVEDADLTFDDTISHLRACFAKGQPVIGICAAGILIRALAPVLGNKRVEPPVIAVAEDGSAMVPLLGGHNGANDLARQIAEAFGIAPAITTAGDVRLGVALDAPPPGWVLANRDNAKQAMADILSGAAVTLDGAFDWLDRARLTIADDAAISLVETVSAEQGGPGRLIYHPKSLVVGVGCERGCGTDELHVLVETTLKDHGLAPQAVAAIVSLDLKADEAAVHDVARALGVAARFVSAAAINLVSGRIENRSEIVMREVGVPGVAEGAALVAVGADGTLIVPKRKSQRATCAIAESSQPVIVADIARARGRLSVIGIGPGNAGWRSPEATRLLSEASDWVGYGLYLDLVADLARGAHQHRFDLGAEEDRVRHALELAGEGRDVALVCSGDAGIYAMATLVFDLIALGSAPDGVSDAARRVEITVSPGISAVQAAAARAGAPIGHDFCCISLSDLLTPWETIERRVKAAADGDFVVAFYNPRSMRRRDQIVRAMAILTAKRPAQTPVIIAASLGRDGERIETVPLSAFDPDRVDMLSIVIVGASTSRMLTTGDGRGWVFTPRGYDAKRGAA